MARIIIILLSYLMLSCSPKSCEEYFNEYSEKIISGKVVMKKLYKANRNMPSLKVNNQNKIIFVSPYMYDTFSVNNLWKCVEIGDSIYKPAKSLEFTVFKQNGDTLNCRYDCNYWSENNSK